MSLQNRLYSIVFLAILLCSCAGLNKNHRDNSQNNFTERVSLGLYLVEKKGNVVVEDVPEGMPLSSVLKSGDIIIAVNDAEVGSRRGILKETQKYTEHDTIVLGIKRGDKQFKVKTRLKSSMVRKDLNEVFKILAAGQKVSLTIIVDQISNSMISDPPELGKWKSGIETKLLSSFENDYLSAFSGDPLFSLADRKKVSEVLEELHFSRSGAVSHEERQQLGKFLGATHILFLEFSRLRSGDKPYSDTKIVRLIEVATDRVVASLYFTE